MNNGKIYGFRLRFSQQNQSLEYIYDLTVKNLVTFVHLGRAVPSVSWSNMTAIFPNGIRMVSSIRQSQMS